MSTTQQILANNNVTLEQARSFIYANVTNPSAIFNAAHSVGVTSDMLGEIAGVSGSLVRNYFTQSGLDVQLLDGATQNPNGISDYVFLTDLMDGDVFLYNPLTRDGERIYSFGRSITDVAVDATGNIYVSDFSNIYKYTVGTGAMTTLVPYGGSFNSLAIQGNTLYAASSGNDVLMTYNKDTGAFTGWTTLAGGGSAGDIAFIGNELYRTTMSYGLVDQNLATTVSTATDSTYWGLTATANNHLWAFSGSGAVLEVDPATKTVTALPNVSLVGLSQVSGAAEAQNIHVTMFL